jgi:hypothetical protein
MQRLKSKVAVPEGGDLGACSVSQAPGSAVPISRRASLSSSPVGVGSGSKAASVLMPWPSTMQWPSWLVIITTGNGVSPILGSVLMRKA